MRFTWDESKSTENERKHGVRFEDAVLVFDDPFYLVYEDLFVHGEQRLHALGYAQGVALLLVVHTYPEEGETRIISARKAIQYERERYEAGN